jgi:hypothetical protein
MIWKILGLVGLSLVIAYFTIWLIILGGLDKKEDR